MGGEGVERSGEKRKGRLLRVMSRQLPALRGGGGAAAVGPSRARRGARVTWQEQRGERAGHSWRLRFPLSPPPPSRKRLPPAASSASRRAPLRRCGSRDGRCHGRHQRWAGAGRFRWQRRRGVFPFPPPPGLPRWAPPPVRGLYGGRGGAKAGGGRAGGPGEARRGGCGGVGTGGDGSGPSIHPSVRPPSRPSSGGGGQQRGGSRPEPREGRWAPRGAARPATPPFPVPRGELCLAGAGGEGGSAAALRRRAVAGVVGSALERPAVCVLLAALISLSFGGAVGLMFLMLGCALPQYK